MLLECHDVYKEAIAVETCEFVVHTFDVIEEMEFVKVFIALAAEEKFLLVPAFLRCLRSIVDAAVVVRLHQVIILDR